MGRFWKDSPNSRSFCCQKQIPNKGRPYHNGNANYGNKIEHNLNGQEMSPVCEKVPLLQCQTTTSVPATFCISKSTAPHHDTTFTIPTFIVT
jgi:hypothetical protein